MVNNHLPPCTFSPTECLQWWAFTPVKKHPLQDFGPEMGVGICPRVGLYPELYGIPVCKQNGEVGARATESPPPPTFPALVSSTVTLNILFCFYILSRRGKENLLALASLTVIGPRKSPLLALIITCQIACHRHR